MPPSAEYLFWPWVSLGINRKGNNPIMPRRHSSSQMKNLMRKKMALKGKASLILGQKIPITLSNTSHVRDE
jgi:hypothetical protein